MPEQAIAIMYIGTVFILMYVANSMKEEEKLLPIALKFLLFFGAFGYLLLGLNYTTMLSSSSCMAAGITTTMQTGYSVMTWIFWLLLFLFALHFLIEVIATLKIAADKKQRKKLFEGEFE